MHHAASFASLEMIELLVKAGAKPLANKVGKTSVDCARGFSSTEQIKLTPLHMVVMNFTECAQSEVPSCIYHLVVKGGVDINAVSLVRNRMPSSRYHRLLQDGNTALHFAAERNRQEYAAALLNLGAEIKTIVSSQVND